jgi:DNA polymerase-1
MTVLEAIAAARMRNIMLSVNGDRIHVKAPTGALTRELQEALTVNRSGVLAELCRDSSHQEFNDSCTSESGKQGFNLVTTLSALAPMALAVKQAATVALDIETTGLDPILHRPRLLQLGLPDGSIHVIDLWTMSNIGVLGKALATVTAVGHNIQFDLGFLKHHYGITVRQARCTMTAAQLIDGGLHSNTKEYFTLAAVTDRYLGVELDKQLQMSDWSGPLTLEQLSYAAADVKQLLTLYDILDQRLRENGLAGVYHLECAVIPVVVDMALAGVSMNPKRWHDYLTTQEQALRVLKDKLAAKLPEVNVNSPKQLLPALRSLGCAVESTGADALAAFKDKPVVQHITEYRRVSKFVVGMGTAIAKAIALHGDNRVHVPLRPLGAPTGRMSCRKPNLLALPKNAAVRSCIEPSPGFVFVCADYAAIELRVVANMTNDPRMLEVFNSGGDPHRATAALLLNKLESEVSKTERQRAKAVNFGFVFGMGPATFVEYALSNYGVTMSLAEAAGFKQRYLAAYPKVAEWHRSIGCEKPPVVRTASGRWRKFDDREKGFCERLNTPVQGTAADGMKRAMVILHERLQAFGARLILTVHDEVLVEAPIDVAEQVKSVVVTAMTEGMQEFVKSVPIIVEANLRRTWAEDDSV